MKKTLVILLCTTILAAVCLSGCGKTEPPPPPPRVVTFSAGEFPAETADLTVALKPGEVSLLDEFDSLTSADLSGSEAPGEILQWAEAHPDVSVTYTVTLPDGTVAENDLAQLDLSGIDDRNAAAWAEAVSYLPGISEIELGQQRDGLSWDGIGLISDALPDANLSYSFTIYGQEHTLRDTEINLSHMPVDDNGEAVRQAMRFMPELKTLDMDTCGVSDEDMASIRDEFPDVNVVWRIWFGDNYSVRTDVERILASKPTVGGDLVPGKYECMKYCTKVKYLDLGHNPFMTDIDFVQYMPELEVAIFALDPIDDATPLSYCPNLEYLEIQTTNLHDVTPLAGLKNLRHLNIAHCFDLSDISPLYGLTELERLWVGCFDPVPPEQIEEMQRCAPNCEIDTYQGIDPTGGRWRYVDYNELSYQYILHDRYQLLREQFGDYSINAFSFSWNDPLY